MIYILYFKSRKHFADKSTWSKEAAPCDWTEREVARAAKLAGCEGYAVRNFSTGEVLTFKWFV